MKIAFEARALESKGGGVKTYVSQLFERLSRYDGVELSRLSNPSSEIMLLPWLYRGLPREVEGTGADVAHFTKAAIPFKKMSVPTVVTIYDLIPIWFPASQSLSRRLYWPATLRHAATHADHVLTISEASKQDMVEKFDVEPNKVTVTRLAVDTDHFSPRSGERESNNPYILFVGTRDKRKNVPLLIRAFASIAKNIPHTLVIAGKPGLRTDGAEAQARTLGIEDRVKFLGFVSYEELPELYSKADLFVWPSVMEGWGFPPQEAMACGTPVIVSDGKPLPEVVGNAGEVVPFSVDGAHERTEDLEFERALADRIVQVLQDGSARQRMRQAGLAYVKDFSWDDVVRRTVEVYQSLVT